MIQERSRWRCSLATAATVVAAGVLACETLLALPEEEPLIDGVIVAVGKELGSRPVDDSATLQRIHIKQDPSEECGTVFNVVANTIIGIHNSNGQTVKGDVRDLIVGARARGWTENPVALSCPSQALAHAIEITSS